MANIYRWFGVQGVVPEERRSAYITEIIFEWFMIFIVIFLLLQNFLIDNHYMTSEQMFVMRWFIWAFFMVELILVSSLCKKPLYYVTGNWLNIVIIILALPLYWQQGTAVSIIRILRVILILYLLLPLGRRTNRVLSPRRLGNILLLFILTTIIAGLFLSYIDPDVHGPWQGIWWAFQTITTVGYGDVLPKTIGGRVFAMFFMLLGVGLLATLSASFAYFLLRRKTLDDTQSNTKDIIEEMGKMQKTIDNLRDEIKKAKE